MGVVSLNQRGLVYETEFDSDALDPQWEVAPNDPARYSLTEVSGSLRLNHGADPLYVFFSDLTEMTHFVLDVRNSYNPTSDGDVGGIVVYTDDGDYVKLEEYYDSTKGVVNAYPWLRLVRNDNNYAGYWSSDGKAWNFLGAEEFDGLNPKIGLFLEGGEGQPMDIEYVRIVRSPKIKVSNLSGGVRVELLDSFGETKEVKVCRTGDTEVYFNVPALPIDGKFKVTLADGEVFISSDTFAIWSGDEYAFSPSLDLYYIDDQNSEVHISNNLEEFLGYLNTGDIPYKNVRMVVKNLLQSGSVKSVTVALVQYNGTDDYQNIVKMADDVGGSLGTFVTQLGIGTMGAGTSHNFWIHLDRPIGWLSQHAYFGLDITSSYEN